MDVALFVPCYVDQLYPRVAMATVELLERLGCTVHVPKGQTCCGQPLANSGFPDGAAPLASRMVDVFKEFEHVVCPVAGHFGCSRRSVGSALGDLVAP